MATILAVAGDEAFSAMLKEGLESLGPYQVILCNNEPDARKIVARRDIDLVIVDVDFEEIKPVQFVQTTRQMKPRMPVMWMPFLGDDLSDEMKAVDVQGILTKPFFMEDLRGCIAAALSPSQTQPVAHVAPVVVPVVVPEVPLERPQQPPEPEDKLSDPAAVQRRLDKLLQALSAESAMVLSRKGRLLAWTGFAEHRMADELAAVLMGEIEAANRVAAILGAAGGRFLNGIHEGDQCRLFSMSIADNGLVMCVVLRSDTPLGMVRYHVKQAAADLYGLV
jgi:DNA-binding response OmpR family regulator